MTDQQALLAAILAQPDDDTPRLVYADWLDENGQPDRAAFVRAQIEAARAEPYSKQARAAEKRAGAIREKRRHTWAAPLPGTYDIDFERGFIGHITAGTFGFREAAAGLFAAHPIRSLRVEQYED